MPIGGVIFLTVAGGIASVVLVVEHLNRTVRERRIRHALKAAIPSSIRDARDGTAVKLVGEVLSAGRAIEAPLSGRACAFYVVRVEEYGASFGERAGWRETVREEKGVDFLLRDDTGVALVRASGNSLPSLVYDRKARQSEVLHSHERLERFLRERGHGTEGLVFRKNFRAQEGVVEAGERVVVGGLARWEPDASAAGGGYREMGKRLVIESSPGLPIFLSDDPDAI